jgi:hypothetical protein
MNKLQYIAQTSVLACLVQDLAKLWQFAQFDKVEPYHISDPLCWLGWTYFEVEGSPSLNECLKLLVLDGIALQ